MDRRANRAIVGVIARVLRRSRRRLRPLGDQRDARVGVAANSLKMDVSKRQRELYGQGE